MAIDAATAARRGRLRLPSAPLIWLSLPLVLLVGVAVLAPLLPLDGARVQDLNAVLQPPVWAGGSWSHPLGSDQLGRDVLARLILGARLTFAIAGASMVAGLVPGTLLGLLAGYAGGPVDRVISRLADAQLAIPALLLAMAVVASRGNSVSVLVFVFALASWPQYARVVRAEVGSLRERPFVMGLRAAGLRERRIALRHVLPNVFGIVVVVATLQTGTIVLAESAVSFLGFGVTPPDISWGQMLADGKDLLTSAWWVAVIPGLAIALVVLNVSLLGDALATEMDPRRKR